MNDEWRKLSPWINVTHPVWDKHILPSIWSTTENPKVTREIVNEEAEKMKRHFVVFYSPGTFVAETSEIPIKSWDVERAKELARGVKERYGATPYGFRFITRVRGDDDLDSHEAAHSPMYYLGGKVETLADVKARATEKDAILVSNMECNGYKRIITNNNSWSWTQPLDDSDVVLEWEPRQ